MILLLLGQYRAVTPEAADYEGCYLQHFRKPSPLEARPAELSLRT